MSSAVRNALLSSPVVANRVAAPQGIQSRGKMRNVPNFTPDQMRIFKQLMGGVGSGLEGGLSQLNQLASGEQDSFSQMEAPAFRQLQGQLGQLGSRFADMGALGSSGFQQMASGATTDLAERLQSQRMGMQQDALDRLLSLSDRILGERPYDTTVKEGTDWGGMFGKVLGGAAGSFLGPFGGAVGAGLGEKALPEILKMFGLG